MKKSLKLLIVLLGTTTVPLSTVACNQQNLDEILNLINKGNTKYLITDFLDEEDINSTKKEYSLSVEKTNKVLKEIVNNILIKAKNEEKIIWDDESPKENEKCYNLNINNGKKEGDILTWEVNHFTQRFTVKVSYEVGVINSQNKFVPKQKIDMSFDIKCGTSESDKIVDKWVNNFNDKNWNETNPLNIDLTSQKIEIPDSDINWSDLEQKVTAATYNAIYQETIIWPIGTVTWEIINLDKTITKDKKLNLSLSVNLNDASKQTKDFYILFN